MHRASASALRERFFRISVVLKGLDALAEIVSGLALLIIKPEFFLRLIALLTQDELEEDPRDFVANQLANLASHISIGAQHFAAFYLLVHGVVKIILVVALLQDKRWAYPWAIGIFGAFIVYQLYRFTYTHSLGLIALSVFDVIVIWLIWLEYRARLRGAA
jgi:uncharacterized membrane protein